MSVYLDTSVLVASLTLEASTPLAQAWLSAQPQGSLYVSGWVMAEFSSALSLKVRTGQLRREDQARAQAAFERLLRDSLVIVPLPAEAFVAAAQLAGRHELNLRAADALHLAICAARGLTLCTLDRRLAEAAAQVSVEVQTP